MTFAYVARHLLKIAPDPSCLLAMIHGSTRRMTHA